MDVGYSWAVRGFSRQRVKAFSIQTSQQTLYRARSWTHADQALNDSPQERLGQKMRL